MALTFAGGVPNDVYGNDLWSYLNFCDKNEQMKKLNMRKY
jgi:hypothetical protein